MSANKTEVLLKDVEEGEDSVEVVLRKDEEIEEFYVGDVEVDMRGRGRLNGNLQDDGNFGRDDEDSRENRGNRVSRRDSKKDKIARLRNNRKLQTLSLLSKYSKTEKDEPIDVPRPKTLEETIYHLAEEYGIDLDSKYKFDLSKISLDFLNKGSVANTRFGTYFVPPVWARLEKPPYVRNYIMAVNRSLLGFPSRQYTSLRQMLERAKVYFKFEKGKVVGSDQEHSIIAAVPTKSTASPQTRKKEKQMRGKEVKTKATLSREEKRANVEKQRILRRLQRAAKVAGEEEHPGVVKALSTEMTSAEIAAVWKVVKSTMMGMNGMWKYAEAALQKLCDKLPVLRQHIITGRSVLLLRRLVSQLTLQELSARDPTMKAKSRIVAQTTIHIEGQPHEITAYNISAFTLLAREKTKTELVAFGSIMERQVEKGKWPMRYKPKNVIRYCIGAKIFKSSSVRGLLEMLGLDCRQILPSAHSGSASTFDSLISQLKGLFKEFGVFVEKYPILTDTIVFFIAGATLYSVDKFETTKAQTAVLALYCATYFGGSYVLRRAVECLVAERETEEEEKPSEPEPKAHGASVFELPKAFMNGLRAILGKNYDHDKLVSDAFVAHKLTMMMNFVNSSYRLAATILTLLTKIVPWVYEKATGRPWSKDEVEENLSNYNTAYEALRLHVENTAKLSDAEFANNVNSLCKCYAAIPRKHSAFVQYQRNHLALLNNLSRYFGTGAGSQTRPVPVHLVLSGLPGTGKTVAASNLCAAVNSLFSRPYTEIYAPVVTSVYHENYYNQFSCLLDDQAQARTEELYESLMLQLFFMISPAPFYLDVAAVDDKGKKMFTSKFVVTTTNSPVIQLADGVRHPMAFIRRVHIDACVVRHGENSVVETVFGIAPTSGSLQRFRHFLPEATVNDRYEVAFPTMVKIVQFLIQEHDRDHTRLLVPDAAFMAMYPQVPVGGGMQAVIDNLQRTINRGGHPLALAEEHRVEGVEGAAQAAANEPAQAQEENAANEEAAPEQVLNMEMDEQNEDFPLGMPEARSGEIVLEEGDDEPDDPDEWPSCWEILKKGFSILAWPYKTAKSSYERVKQLQTNAAKVVELTITCAKLALISVISVVGGIVAYLCTTKFFEWAFGSRQAEKQRTRTVTIEFADDYYEPSRTVFEREVATEPHSYTGRKVQGRREVKQVVVQAHSAVANEMSKISANVVHLEVGKEQHHAIFVKGRWLMATCHIFQMCSPDSNVVVTFKNDKGGMDNDRTYAYRLSELEVRKNMQEDLSMVELPVRDMHGRVLESQPSIEHFFIDDVLALNTVASEIPVFAMQNSSIWSSSKMSGNIQIVQYMHGRSNTTFTTTTLRMYMSSIPGDCVLPVCLQKPLNGSVLLGIIISGHGDYTYVAPRSKRMLRGLMEPPPLQAYGYVKNLGMANRNNSTTQAIEEHLTRAQDHYYVKDSATGKVITFSSLPNKSKFEPNPHVRDEMREAEAPARLIPTIVDGEIISPLFLAFDKIDIKEELGDGANEQVLLAEFVNYFRMVLGDILVDPVTPEVAFFGNEIIPRFRPASSAGVIEGRPHKVSDLSFESTITTLDGQEQIVEALYPFVLTSLQEYKKHPWKFPASCSLKDELRDIERVKACKTRLFYAVNAIQNLDAKIYEGNFWALMRKFGRPHGFMVGTPFGIHWGSADVVRLIETYRDCDLLMGDFKGYDRYRSPKLWRCHTEAKKRFYHPMHHKELDRIADTLYNPYVALGQQCFRLKNIQLSGGLATAESNTVDTQVAIRYIFRIFGCSEDLQFLMAYGDDFVAFVKKGSRVNCHVLRDNLKRLFGWELVSADKVSDLKEAYDFDEFSFCKRRFMNGNLVLEYEALENAGAWRKRSTIQDNGLLAMHSALQEAQRYNDSFETVKKLYRRFRTMSDYTHEELWSAFENGPMPSLNWADGENFEIIDGGQALSGPVKKKEEEETEESENVEEDLDRVYEEAAIAAHREEARAQSSSAPQREEQGQTLPIMGTRLILSIPSPPEMSESQGVPEGGRGSAIVSMLKTVGRYAFRLRNQVETSAPKRRRTEVEEDEQPAPPSLTMETEELSGNGEEYCRTQTEEGHSSLLPTLIPDMEIPEEIERKVREMIEEAEQEEEVTRNSQKAAPESSAPAPTATSRQLSDIEEEQQRRGMIPLRINMNRWEYVPFPKDLFWMLILENYGMGCPAHLSGQGRPCCVSWQELVYTIHFGALPLWPRVKEEFDPEGELNGRIREFAMQYIGGAVLAHLVPGDVDRTYIEYNVLNNGSLSHEFYIWFRLYSLKIEPIVAEMVNHAKELQHALLAAVLGTNSYPPAIERLRNIFDRNLKQRFMHLMYKVGVGELTELIQADEFYFNRKLSIICHPTPAADHTNAMTGCWMLLRMHEIQVDLDNYVLSLTPDTVQYKPTTPREWLRWKRGQKKFYPYAGLPGSSTLTNEDRFFMHNDTARPDVYIDNYLKRSEGTTNTLLFGEEYGYDIFPLKNLNIDVARKLLLKYQISWTPAWALAITEQCFVEGVPLEEVWGLLTLMHNIDEREAILIACSYYVPTLGYLGWYGAWFLDILVIGFTQAASFIKGIVKAVGCGVKSALDGFKSAIKFLNLKTTMRRFLRTRISLAVRLTEMLHFRSMQWTDTNMWNTFEWLTGIDYNNVQVQDVWFNYFNRPLQPRPE